MFPHGLATDFFNVLYAVFRILHIVVYEFIKCVNHTQKTQSAHGWKNSIVALLTGQLSDIQFHFGLEPWALLIALTKAHGL